jgi:hypothetical protein
MFTTNRLRDRARQAQPYVALAGHHLRRAIEGLGLAILWVVKAAAESLPRFHPEREPDWLECLTREGEERRELRVPDPGRKWMGEPDPPPWSDFWDRRP